jgi:hypothetical protein
MSRARDTHIHLQHSRNQVGQGACQSTSPGLPSIVPMTDSTGMPRSLCVIVPPAGRSRADFHFQLPDNRDLDDNAFSTIYRRRPPPREPPPRDPPALRLAEPRWDRPPPPRFLPTETPRFADSRPEPRLPTRCRAPCPRFPCWTRFALARPALPGRACWPRPEEPGAIRFALPRSALPRRACWPRPEEPGPIRFALPRPSLPRRTCWPRPDPPGATRAALPCDERIPPPRPCPV